MPRRVTRKGNAIPGDRRQEVRASTGQRPEAVQTAESRETGNNSGWSKVATGRSLGNGRFRVRKASRRYPSGGKGAHPGNRRQGRRKQVKPGGRKTSINKAGVEGPCTVAKCRVVGERTELERPRKICSSSASGVPILYTREEAHASSLFVYTFNMPPLISSPAALCFVIQLHLARSMKRHGK